MGPSPSPQGQIQLITGGMFSGKTSELFRRIRRYSIKKLKCLVIKWINDDRYSVRDSDGTDQEEHKVVSHNGETMRAKAYADLANPGNLLDSYDVIAIDEGQFFKGLVTFCETLANVGKIVIVAALDATFERKPFGEVHLLMPLAEKVTKLTAVCKRCQGSASFTRRRGDATTSTATVLIGGADLYEANCRRCWFEYTKLYPVKPAGVSCATECISDVVG